MPASNDEEAGTFDARTEVVAAPFEETGDCESQSVGGNWAIEDAKALDLVGWETFPDEVAQA